MAGVLEPELIMAALINRRPGFSRTLHQGTTESRLKLPCLLEAVNSGARRASNTFRHWLCGTPTSV